MEELNKDELVVEATDLGIEFHPSTGAKKIKEKIDAYYESQETSGKEIEEAIESNEKSEEKSAESGKLTKGQRIANARAKANKTRVVTVIDNDQRVNNQTTTFTANCSNAYFDLGTIRLPLGEPIEIRQGHINVLKEVKIPQHAKDNTTGLSTVRLIPRYTLQYQDNK